METITFLVTLFIVGVIWYFKTCHETFIKALKLPGPPILPIIGCSLDFLGKSPPQLLKLLEKFSKIYGRTVRLMVGTQVLVLISDPKDVEVILGSQKLLSKSNEYDYIARWLGTGLLISTGQKWFGRRKVITPTFHFKILEQFVEVFDKQSKIFIQNLAKRKGKQVDVFPLVTLSALDVICETSMGVEVHAQINSDSVYVKAVKEMSEIVASKFFNPFYRNDFIFWYFGRGKREKEVLKILHDFTDNVIRKRRAEVQAKLNSPAKDDQEEDDIGTKKKMALLDVLLQSTIDGKPLTNLDIREEVDTFVFEGHDTTTSGIAFLLYNLAKHPEIQQKAFDEIRNVIGDDPEKPVKQKDLNDLSYLDLCIKETLRLYPSVPYYGRRIYEDLDLNGKIIPAGSNIGVGPFFMARDETLWENALEFKPERFEIDNLKQHPYGHVPFSAGPRNCIGQKFAILEMKSTVSKTLRNFELSVAKDYEPVLVAEMIIRPINGVQLVMQDRVYK